MSSPLYLAIDHPHLDAAVTLAQKVRHHVGGLKLGLEFFCANGHHGVHEMAKLGLPIFLDLKLHDIPNTVAKAIQALRPLEPAILTVHAAGGRAMLEEAKAVAGLNTKVVAVTVLTSLDAPDLDDIGVGGTPHDQVVRLAALAREAGLDGIVCSGQEVKAARKAWPGGFFVVPGCPSLERQRGRPETRRHPGTGDGRWRLDPGRRPPDQPVARPRPRRARQSKRRCKRPPHFPFVSSEVETPIGTTIVEGHLDFARCERIA